MPELPEVETIVRALRPRLEGCLITSARYSPSRVFRGEFPPELAGARIERVRRHGKYILWGLDRGTLAMHLGMTGKLLFNAPQTPYVRAEFDLEGLRLTYDDIRQFGRIAWSEALPSLVARLGPDPLEVPLEEFRRGLQGRKTNLKALLLNQGFLRGLGNIYVDEALFRAEIHPLMAAHRLQPIRVERLWEEIRELLEEAIAHGGSSISDYVNTEGKQGSFQREHRVYGREGKECLRCGRTILKIVVAQRGTHYCEGCQRR